jgi:triosephosphate isomerase
MRKKLIAGNWKMNKTSADGVALARELVGAAAAAPSVEVVICPPFTALEGVAAAIDGSAIKLGAQNMHFEPAGAFTGEVSAPMLRALFATHVILGHSERRTLFGETDQLVSKKVLAALKHQLRPIICVGESLAPSLVIAYEPIWAIGTGKVATTEQAQEVHAFIRGLLAKVLGDPAAQRIRILYGGSMKPANAPELLAQKDIDGGLIGGASLEARSFTELIHAAAAAA